MTDFFMLEEIQKMIKSIPKPRLVFKKGITVTGYFQPYMSLIDYTDAIMFKDQSEITPVTVRFSSMLGDKGTADTVRNIKSMAVKFHSHDEVYDVICLNIPETMTDDVCDMDEIKEIFHIRDYFDGIDSEKLWKYVAEHIKFVPFVLMLYSHLGISDSFINIKYYSVNKYNWQKEKSKYHVVKYKWVPVNDSNIKYIDEPRIMTANTAEFIAGYDPNRGIKEVIRNIKTNKYPVFELHVQMVEENMPYMCVGVMVLERITSNLMDESVCFFPGNTPSGIEVVEDDLTGIMDFFLKTEAMERGTYL